jgi:hypothetical protein
LIAVKRTFNVSELSTKNQSLIEHECGKLNVASFSCIFQRFTYLEMSESVPTTYLWKKSQKEVTDNSDLCDVNLVLGDCNLPIVSWKLDEKNGSVLPLNGPGN